MSTTILVGPFLTRPTAARLAGLTEDELKIRPDLLRLGGDTYREAYFDFQFSQNGIRRDIGTVVLALRGRVEDAAIADWLVRRNLSLTGNSPLSWMNQGGRVSSILDAIEAKNRQSTGGIGIWNVETNESTSRVAKGDDPRGTSRKRRSGFPRPASSH